MGEHDGTRRTVRAGTAALAAACLLTPASGMAAPASDGAPLEVSTDGVHWAAHDLRPLFPSNFRWVPGDRSTATFHVRNTARQAGHLTLLTTDVPDFVSASVRAPSGRWVALDRVGSTDLGRLRSGEDRTVTVRLAMAAAVRGRTDQDRRGRLGLDVRLSQVGGGIGPDTVGPDRPGGATGPSSNAPLPGTGASFSHRLLRMGLGALGAGLLALAWARRRRSEPHQVPHAVTEPLSGPLSGTERTSS